jgi:hypothetical protein
MKHISLLLNAKAALRNKWHCNTGNSIVWYSGSCLLQRKQHQLSNSKKTDQGEIYFARKSYHEQTCCKRVDTKMNLLQKILKKNYSQFLPLKIRSVK